MSQTRAPWLAAVAVLLAVALLIAWFLLQQRGRPQDDSHNEPTRVADQRPDRPRDQPGTGADKHETPKSNAPGDTHDDPPAEVKTSIRISGRTVDGAGDAASALSVTLLPDDDATVTGPTAVSDDSGAFAFDATLIVGSRHFVACLMQGKALCATPVFTIEAGKPVEGLLLKVLDQARAFGVVLNAADNTPIEGARIETTARGNANLQRLGALLGRLKPCLSDVQGRFALENLAPGEHVISAAKKGWSANDVNPLTRGRQAVELAEYANFELLPFLLVQSGIIEGRVLAKKDNAPIVGATVDLGTILGGSFGMTTTDAEGKYRFDNAPPTFDGGTRGNTPGGELGALAVRATAPGYAIGTRNVRVASGETVTGVDILLDPGCTVTGRVINHKAEPVAGSSVYFNDSDYLRGGEWVVGIAIPPRHITTTTDAEGKFKLDSLPPRSLEIAASAKGYSNGVAQALTVIGTPVEVTITLQPQAVIFGKITEQRGAPVAGAAIAAYETDRPGQLSFLMKSFFGETLPDRGDSMIFPASVRSGEDGSYRIEGLKAAKYVLVANSPKFEKHISGEIELKAGTEQEYNIVLPPGGTIFGRVYDGTGKPVSGVPVTAARMDPGESMRVKTAYTDRSGNYELVGLAPGTFNVVRNDGSMMTLMMPNVANKVAVKAGERVQFDIYAQKPGTARIYGRVTLDGQVYKDSQLILIGGGYAGFAANFANTDGDGRYEFRSVPLGVYQIARGGRMGPSLVRARVRADKAGDIEFNIDYVTVSISGRVEMEGGGVPEGNVRVFASPVSPEGAEATNADENVNELEMLVAEEARADEKGAFTLPGLSPGFYRLSARGEKAGIATKPYLNVRASVGGIVLQLPLKSATLKGIVKGLDGAKPNTPLGLTAALTIEDDKGKPLLLGQAMENAVILTREKEFTKTGLPEGAFTLTLSLTGYAPVTHRGVKFTAGETTTLEFAFASSGGAKFSVTNTDLSMSSAYELQFDIVNSKNEVFKKRFTFLDFFNQDGTASDLGTNSFVLKDFPPETYTITLKLPGYKNCVKSFVIVAGETAEVPVTFEKQ